MSQDIETYLDNIMSYMALSDASHEFGKMHRFPLSHFSPALVICDEKSDGIHENLDHRIQEDGIFMDAELEDISDLNRDISIIKDGHAEGLKYQIIRYRLMQPKEKRGYYFGAYPTMEAVYCQINEHGKFTTGRAFYVRRGKQWVRATGDNGPMGKPYDGNHTEDMQSIFGLIFYQYFKWNVTLGYEGYPHISIACTPAGAREVFKLRDIPEGKSRRTAIKHWVGEHSRRKKADSDEYIKVLDYLRGETVFNWNGLNCSIKPSQSDLNHYHRLHKRIA